MVLNSRAGSPYRLPIDAFCEIRLVQNAFVGGGQIQLASSAFVTVVVKFGFRAHSMSVEEFMISCLA